MNHCDEPMHAMTLCDVLDRLLILQNVLHKEEAIQSYVVYSAFQMLKQLIPEMHELDQIANEEYEAYISSLVEMDCPFDPITEQTKFGGN